MFNNYLEMLKRDKKLVSIYRGGNSTKFSVGFIKAHNNEDYIFISIAPDGRYDGVCLYKNDITKLEYDGLYEKKIEQLMGKEDREKVEKAERDINFDNGRDLSEQLLAYIKSENRIASFELLDSGYDDAVGFITNTDNEYCCIASVDENGTADSTAVIRKEDITRISFDGPDEVQTEKLFFENSK